MSEQHFPLETLQASCLSLNKTSVEADSLAPPVLSLGLGIYESLHSFLLIMKFIISGTVVHGCSVCGLPESWNVAQI